MASENIPAKMGKLALYYGYPSLVNNVAGNVESAIKNFAAYDVVVFGAGLEDKTHADNANTEKIIKGVPKQTRTFGYVSVGMTQKKVSIMEIKENIKKWKEMGTFGIFLDCFGYDYGVTRERQNDVLSFVHDQGFVGFINAFEPDDVFSATPVPTNSVGGGNPNGKKAVAVDGDYYLFDGFQVQDGQYADPEFWVVKSQKTTAYRKEWKFKTMATTRSGHDVLFKQEQLDYAWWSAVLFGFDGFCWGEKWYAAGDNLMPLRKRPEVDVGKKFDGDVIIEGHLYSRKTDKGMIVVDGDKHSGTFKPTK